MVECKIIRTMALATCLHRKCKLVVYVVKLFYRRIIYSLYTGDFPTSTWTSATKLWLVLHCRQHLSVPTPDLQQCRSFSRHDPTESKQRWLHCRNRFPVVNYSSIVRHEFDGRHSESVALQRGENALARLVWWHCATWTRQTEYQSTGGTKRYTAVHCCGQSVHSEVIRRRRMACCQKQR